MDYLIDLHNITRVVRQLSRRWSTSRCTAARPHRLARAQRRRQIDAAEDPDGPACRRRPARARARSTDRRGDRSRSELRLRRLIGFMPEADALVPGLRGVEYVALAGELYGMPRRQAQRRAHEVLTYLELEEARYRKLEEYSTGMKQRLKLAQALVHDPPVLLLDEPTSGLDPAGRDAMLRLLLELGRDHGKSLILSTHLLADVEAVCERVVILMNGQVRGQGTVAELCTRRQDRYRLQIQGDSESFQRDLAVEGVQVLHDNGRGELRVSVPAGWNSRTFFTMAASTGVLLRGVVRDDETLEELFLRTVATK